MNTSKSGSALRLQITMASRKSFSLNYLFCLMLLIIFLTSVYQCAYTQDNVCTLSGIISDAITGELLAGANIILSPGEHGTSSDLQGRFNLKRLLPGTYEISISYIGYSIKSDTVLLKSGQSLYLQIRLQPHPISMQEITVSARRSPLFQKVNLSQDALSSQEIRMTTSLVEPDLIRSLAHLPGVVLSNDFNPRFYVRGGRGNENHVLVDGVTLYNPYHAFGFFNIFDTDAIKSVEILKKPKAW